MNKPSPYRFSLSASLFALSLWASTCFSVPAWGQLGQSDWQTGQTGQTGQSNWQTPSPQPNQGNWQSSGASQLGQSNWQTPSSQSGQSNWQSSGGSQNQWTQAGPQTHPGQWAPGMANSQFSVQVPSQSAYEEQPPGSYLNQPSQLQPLTDSLSTSQSANISQPAQNLTVQNNATTVQTGHVAKNKNHEGMKTAISGVGKALETAATMAAPMAGGYMLGRAMSGGYGYPFGMMRYGTPFGYGMPMMGMGMMNPYMMGMPLVNGLSSFFHY